MNYALFHSILNYGIIAWGGAYSNNVNLVENIQKKILKIINKNQFSQHSIPLNVRQLFQLESVTYHYHKLKKKYIESKSNTRNKIIQLPKMKKE